MTRTEQERASTPLDMSHRPRIGLALSGGGARGLSHIGVLQALERAGIPVDCVAGTSMGGIIAAGYAAGLSVAELEQEAKAATRLRRLLSLADPGAPSGGLLRGQRLLAFFERYIGQRTFADLRLPLALVAVDLNHRREVVLHEGSVALALRATMAVPGLFEPVELNGQRLVDGGLLNNLPVDVVRHMGADVVIAVDVASTPETSVSRWIGDRRWVPGTVAQTLEILNDALDTLASTAMERKLREFPPDVLISPAVPPGVNMFAGYHRVAELIDCGERAAEASLPQIQELLRLHRQQPAEGETRPDGPAIAAGDNPASPKQRVS